MRGGNGRGSWAGPQKRPTETNYSQAIPPSGSAIHRSSEGGEEIRDVFTKLFSRAAKGRKLSGL
jgi:hypothetical protein